MLESYDFDPDDEFYDEDGERIWADDDPLVLRLRAMTWAEVPTDVRERCWHEIEKRIDDLERQGILPISSPLREVNVENYGFSRRPVPCTSGMRQEAGNSPTAFRPRALALGMR